ncbi:RGS domain-containing serine/threonine-protein kinase A-like [Hydra vulgaris]|uniref:RGS domain-containing serine/threonine-protein kinase A-like n=1 Tax=Hydra vulgaris TaxID=6087 RepID=A0ABM4C4D1_HYDVU
MANFSFLKSKGLNQIEQENNEFIVELPLNMPQDAFIGEGSFAKVYKFVHKKKVVACKLYKHQFPKSKMFLMSNRFKKLNHPNIVAYIGFSIRPLAIFFDYCCVLVENTVCHSLPELLNLFNEESYFNYMERLDYCLQAANGLKYLHDLNIVHHDFKPANILVHGTLSRIVIKLTDFCDLAIMKETMATKTKVKAGFAGLTIAYLSPEICNYTVNTVTKESDVYAMSLSIFEIMSGLDSPWQNHFSIYKDIFLTQALEKGERPDTNIISKIYLESDTRHLVETIVRGWCNDPEERLTCVQIIGRLKELTMVTVSNLFQVLNHNNLKNLNMEFKIN